MKKLNERVAAYLQALAESEARADGPDASESAGLRYKLGHLEEAKRRAAGLLDRIESSPTGQISTVDPDSRLLKKSTSEGAVVGFLAHAAVDGRAHLIVAAEVSTRGNDRGALAGVVTAAEEVLPAASPPEAAPAPEAPAAAGLCPEVAAAPEPGDAQTEGKRQRQLLADGGFFDIDDLHECEQKGLPEQRRLALFHLLQQRRVPEVSRADRLHPDPGGLPQDPSSPTPGDSRAHAPAAIGRSETLPPASRDGGAPLRQHDVLE